MTSRPARHFNPRSSCEERRDLAGNVWNRGYFNPRSSCEERLITRSMSAGSTDFNPRSSCEERQKKSEHNTPLGEFQSTLLMRGATLRQYREAFLYVGHFNPRSSCEERHGSGDVYYSIELKISIHAPHARSDAIEARVIAWLADISIHAPHARSDADLHPHGNLPSLISIHAPHARSDCFSLFTEICTDIFQSTLLMRGATRRCVSVSCRSKNFNPRSSCEERLRQQMLTPISSNFNPRSSCEERQPVRIRYGFFCVISIHAPHARSDDGSTIYARKRRISIHAPHARSDVELQSVTRATVISIHAPHARSDQWLCGR